MLGHSALSQKPISALRSTSAAATQSARAALQPIQHGLAHLQKMASGLHPINAGVIA